MSTGLMALFMMPHHHTCSSHILHRPPADSEHLQTCGCHCLHPEDEAAQRAHSQACQVRWEREVGRHLSAQMECCICLEVRPAGLLQRCMAWLMEEAAGYQQTLVLPCICWETAQG